MKVTIQATADASQSPAAIRLDFNPHEGNPVSVLEVAAGESGELQHELTSLNDRLSLARPANGEPVSVTGTANIDNTDGTQAIVLELRSKEPGWKPLAIGALATVEPGQSVTVPFVLASWSDELRVIDAAQSTAVPM